jgi:hypothetical protein
MILRRRKNKMEELFDLIDMMDYLTDGGFGIFGTIFSGIGRSLGFLNVIGVILLIVMLVAIYVISSFKWQFIGRKAGLQKDWMPFVPFARTVYKLSIVDEAWWRMFFKDGFWFYAWLMITIINAISNYQGLTFAIVLATLYGLCCLAYNVYYRYKFYMAHNIKPHLSLCVLIPPLVTITQVWDYLIAFGRNYPFTGEGTSRAMLDVMDVPQMRDARGNPIPVTQAMKPGSGAPWVADKASPGVGAATPCSLAGLSGMYAGQTIPMAPNDELIIGRDSNLANVIIDTNAEKVSRKHCGIRFDPTRNIYSVTDYSSNGTFIDGESRLVANAPTTLQRGVVINLGNRENRFRLN